MLITRKPVLLSPRTLLATVGLALFLSAFTAAVPAASAQLRTPVPTDEAQTQIPRGIDNTIPDFADQKLPGEGTSGNKLKAADSTKKFFDTAIGNLLVQVARFLAVLLVLTGFYHGAKAMLGGRGQQGGGARAVAMIMGPLFFAGVLMNIAWTASLLTWSADIVSRLFSSVSDLFFG